ncbi:MAG: 6-carboxytetrahydropterin synthase [Lentisphaeria bacterium]|jgi:6-pyruvoyltetrahydropterin/6-carboxytetrahydropterin synthase
MFEIFVKTQFSAAHRLAGYPGNCANWHGHNWDVTVTLGVAELNALGLAVDFRDVKREVGALMAELDHTALNENPAFVAPNPTCEVVARHLYRSLQERLRAIQSPARVLRVQVSETPNAGAVYYE